MSKEAGPSHSFHSDHKADHDPGDAPRVLAVIVLYKMNAEASPAYIGLTRAAVENSTIAPPVEFMICDNTPYTQTRPADFNGLYIQDLENAGLAKRYNQALRRAVDERFDWLLLLDQDTVPTPGYLAEVRTLAQAVRSTPDIVALAPKLVQRGRVLSPTFRLRGHPAIDIDDYGPAPRNVQVFNSGALLKTSALQAMGGFPEHFWLDYLDHATFHSLQAQGGRVFLMRSALDHDLSTNPAVTSRSSTVSIREINILKASRDFFFKYGTPGERADFSIWFLRVVGGALRRGEMQRVRALLHLFMQR